MINPLQYFWIFLKASLFSVGGNGNLPFLHSDLSPLGWAREEDFLTAMAVGQVSPGPSGLWSISLGYLTFGWLGALLALVGLALPPFLVLILAAFYGQVEHIMAVQNFSRGLSLGVVGLGLVVAYSLATSVLTDWIAGLIALAALLLMMTRRVPVIVILILAAVAGMALYLR